VTLKAPQFPTAAQKGVGTGCGLSESHDGGYAEYARMKKRLGYSNRAGAIRRTAMIYGHRGILRSARN